MYTRRQFCGVLGGTVLGGTVLAGSERGLEEKNALLTGDQFFASKVHLERWYAELRHKSPPVRLDELRKRFAEIRTGSEMVLFVSGGGVPNAFHEELSLTAKGMGLRILAPAENLEVADMVLKMIQTEASGFTTLAFPLVGIGNRIQTARPVSPQQVCGYLYTRQFSESLPSVPLAVILFETSRCLWETYVSPEMGHFCDRAYNPRSISRERIECEYARLIDRTCVQFS